MDRNDCPNCRASLDFDQLARRGATDCPFCGEPLPERFLASESGAQESPLSNAASIAPTAITEIVPKSKVSVVEAGDDRQVIYIPPGGKQSRSLGCFAVFWNGFMAVFTGFWVVAGKDAPWFVLVIFLGAFWAIGIAMLIFWIRMRFTRTYLLLERERIAIQRILFGRKSVTETFLGPDSKAELVEAYSQNDTPVYSVVVNGTNRNAKFGTALSQEEKLWFVETINGFLGVVKPGGPDAEPATVERVGFEDVSAGELASDSEVTVHNDDRDHLQFSLPVVPPGRTRTLVPLFCVGFSVFWIGTTGSAAFAALGDKMDFVDWIGLVIAGLATLPGLIPVAVALFVLQGKTNVDITPQEVGCRWGLGKIGYRHALPTSQVTEVLVTVPMAEKYARSGSRRVRRPNDVKVCMLFAGARMLPLTTFHKLRTAKEVAGLARGQLHRMGFTLQDE